MRLWQRLVVAGLYALAMLVFLRLSESIGSFGWAALTATAVCAITGLLHAGFIRLIHRQARR